MTDRDGRGRSGSKGDVMPSSRVVRHIHRGSRLLASQVPARPGRGKP
jgi:hypothetical protein